MKDTLDFLKNNFNYLYPGFISIWFFYFIKGKNIKESSNILIKSIILSYLYINSIPLLKIIYFYIPCKYNFKDILNLNLDFYLLSISLIIPYIICKLSSSSIVNIILKLLGINTVINSNIFDEFLSRTKRTYYRKRIITFLFSQTLFYLKRFLTIILLFIKAQLLNIHILYNPLRFIYNKIRFFNHNIHSLLQHIINFFKKEHEKKAISLSVYLDNSGIMYYGWLKFHESDKNNQDIICLYKYKRYRLNDEKIYVLDIDNTSDLNKYTILKKENVTRIELITQKNI